MTPFEERLQSLRARFIAQASAEAGEIELRAAAMAWNGVRDISHGLVGRAGMFGFAGLSETAGKVEAAIEGGATAERMQFLTRELISQLRELPSEMAG
jgi:HPt (histidine-containing phosphotransfer) domain-containing protein